MPPARPHLALAGLCALVTLGCEEPGPAPAVTARGQRVVSRGPAAPVSAGPLRLGAPSTWTLLNPAGPALVTPRVSPDGRWVAAAGRRGVGLWVMDVTAPGRVVSVDATRQGPWGWTAAPLALCFGGDHGPRRAWTPGGAVGSPPGPGDPWTREWDEDRGALRWQGAEGTWHHHPKRGTVTWTPAGAAPRPVVDHGAWGVQIQAQGRWVAYSTGTLAASHLFVHDRARGETRALGAGVHPAWLPGRPGLIYARVAGVARGPGRSNVTGAELWLYDGVTGDHRALTATTDRAEMEPAVTPAGDAVLLVDWQGGGLWRAPLLGGGAP